VLESGSDRVRDPPPEFFELLLREWQRTSRPASFDAPRTDDWSVAALLARVCRQWRAAVDGWRALQDAVTIEEPTDAACLLISRLVRLRSVSLRSCQRLGMRHGPHLDPNVNDDSSLKAVLHGCLRLETLHLHNAKMADALFLHLEPRALSALRHLTLHNCSELTAVALLEIARRCPQLATLELYAVGRFGSHQGQVTDTTVEAIARACPALRSLQLSFFPALTIASVHALVAAGVRLHRLDLSHGSDHLPTPEAVGLIGRSCPDLRALVLSPRCARGTPADSYDDALRALAHGCPHLEMLDMGDCELTDGAVAELARCCSGLQTLSLPSEASTDGAVLAVGTHCTQLRSLSVSGGSLTDAGLRALVARCPRLEVLHIDDCQHVNAAGLRAIATHCKELRVLTAHGCGDATDGGAGLWPPVTKHQAMHQIVLACKRLTTCVH